MKRYQAGVVILFLLTLVMIGIYLGKEYTYRDAIGPVIQCEADHFHASIQDSEQQLLQGVTAVDEHDGDVRDSLIVESLRMVKDKECAITYAAFDCGDNVSKLSGTVVFDDYVSPHFAISQPLRFVLGTEKKMIESFRAEDCIDGDITNRIKLTSMNPESEYVGAGIHNYEIQVTNSIGDTAVLPVAVEFYADSYEERMYRPQLYLTTYVAYLPAGSAFEPKDYLESVGIGNERYLFADHVDSDATYEAGTEDLIQKMSGDGRPVHGIIDSDDVKYQSNVRTDQPGTYTVEYSYTTKEDYLGTTQMIVVVE